MTGKPKLPATPITQPSASTVESPPSSRVGTAEPETTDHHRTLIERAVDNSQRTAQHSHTLRPSDQGPLHEDSPCRFDCLSSQTTVQRRKIRKQ